MTDSNAQATALPRIDIPALAPLIAALQARFGQSLRGILLYGSCLRSGDYHDGLVDFYLIVDSYAAYGNWRLRLGNILLPPNVFYTEVTDSNGAVVRCKYAIVSLGGIGQATSTRHFESYFWGRFAQPMAAVYCQTEADFTQLADILANARRTFLARTLPALPSQGCVNKLWQQALTLSYSTELRAEKAGRAQTLVAGNVDFFLAASEDFAREHQQQLRIDCAEGKHYYHSHFNGRAKLQARWSWRLRKLWGKSLSLCRLVKALFTFDGGLDYIAWKLQRHSGQPVDIPEKVRRRPLIHIWGLFFRLYRRGVFK